VDGGLSCGQCRAANAGDQAKAAGRGVMPKVTTTSLGELLDRCQTPIPVRNSHFFGFGAGSGYIWFTTQLAPANERSKPSYQF
jgi:hypothetical protein